MAESLRVGQVLYGFCGGAFGRDSYEPKRVEAVGADWVVARDDSSRICFYAGDPEDLLEHTQPACPCCGRVPLAVPCTRCGFE